MTQKFQFALFAMVASIGTVFSQEVTPTDSPLPTVSPTPAFSPTATPTATPAPPRNVRISFVPPPLEGTISLGIYDSSGKLVRVLHQQAPLDAFTIGADALLTKWDGKDDHGQDLPSGRYHAHGFLVGALRQETVPPDPAATPPPNQYKVPVKLTANPLVKNDRPNIELTAGFDDKDSFIKTADELPLYIISQRAGITGVAVAKGAEKSIDIWQESAAGTEHFRISKLDQMMAFDCGAFDLK